MTPEEWLADFARTYGLTVGDLTGPSKQAHITEARHEAMWAARERYGLSYPALGRLIGRNHTTVYAAMRRLSRRRGTPIPPRIPPAPTSCSVDGCGRRATRRGMCEPHRVRTRNHGDPCAHVPIGGWPRTPPAPAEVVWIACEVCGGVPLGGSRWCAAGGCSTQAGRWSWSRTG